MNKFTTACLAALCLAAVAGLARIASPHQALADDTAPEPAAIGTPAPAFTLPNAVTSDDVSLSDYEGKVVVLMFHSTSCPFFAMNENRGYDRIFVQMVRDYADQDVVFLGVNANRNDSISRIQTYITDNDINYTVLKDQGNVVADAYGALVTPHIMVIDATGTLRYRGGVEANPGNPNNCGTSETQYLAPVIDALLNDTELPATETRPVGCGIQRV